MIVRVERHRQYTKIDTAIFDDERLKAAELATLTYLLSRPDDWNAHTEQVRDRLGFGRNKMLGIFNTLIDLRYCRRERYYNGKMGAASYTVYEQPTLHPDAWSGIPAPGFKNQTLEDAPRFKNQTVDEAGTALVPQGLAPKPTELPTPHHGLETKPHNYRDTTTTTNAREADPNPLPSNINIGPAHPLEKRINYGKPKTRMDDNWYPSPPTLDKLKNLHGIDPDYALDLLTEFTAFWADRGDQRNTWEATFISHAQRSWKKQQAEDAKDENNRGKNCPTPGTSPTDNMLRSAHADLPNSQPFDPDQLF